MRTAKQYAECLPECKHWDHFALTSLVIAVRAEFANEAAAKLRGPLGRNQWSGEGAALLVEAVQRDAIESFARECAEYITVRKDDWGAYQAAISHTIKKLEALAKGGK